ncbi:hypothetical protein SETIT_1G139200v2 [Setaria italica]|uniref:Uncharacterized protein n=2 Tax=Setaria italica TaxID=4555 RepID=A0A368PK38_SETIT|nr:hypothetical protein SETIT_1G139200v2 [Setaria italica]
MKTERVAVAWLGDGRGSCSQTKNPQGEGRCTGYSQPTTGRFDLLRHLRFGGGNSTDGGKINFHACHSRAVPSPFPSGFHCRDMSSGGGAMLDAAAVPDGRPRPRRGGKGAAMTRKRGGG